MALISTTLSTPLAAILADCESVPLIIGAEAASELGLAALEHLQGTPSDSDIRNLVGYAARHHESSPARDALVAVLLDASETLRPDVVARARAAIMSADWGPGRESAALNTNPRIDAVPRRQALAERLIAERARRIRPRVLALVMDIVTHGAGAGAIPRDFVERSWCDLRDSLAQRVRNEPMHQDAIARWLLALPAPIRPHFAPVEHALIDVVTRAILHAPETAPLEPWVGEDVVLERVRSATNFRGAPARARLAKYLARLPHGTAWYAAIRAIVEPADTATGS